MVACPRTASRFPSAAVLCSPCVLVPTTDPTGTTPGHWHDSGHHSDGLFVPRQVNTRRGARTAEVGRWSGAPLDEAALFERRQRNFRQQADLRVRSARAALQFVNAVGFCSTFFVFREGPPSLWEAVVGKPRPRWPQRSHHDAGVGLTWELKDVLPRRREVYYGKLL